MSVIGPLQRRSPAVGTPVAPASGIPAATRAPLPSRRERGALLLAVAITVATWLPWLQHPLSPDESGFLLLGQHWTPGTSLYGNHWVDRPPLLIQLFSLAGMLGPVGHTAAGVTAPAVKLLGATAAGASVLLAGLVAREIGAPFARRVVVVAAAGLLSSPLLGVPETDGEVLAVPFVLLGVLLLVRGVRRRCDVWTLLLLAGAGGAGAAAALVKQNVVDVAVLALALLLTARGRVGHLPVRAGAVVVGGLVVLGTVVGDAGARGTTAAGLWDAVVLFRLRASAVIGSSASPATGERAGHLLGAFLASGLGLLLLVAVVGVLMGSVGRHRTVDPLLAWPALAMTAWEALAVALGGSYWLHYLTGLVPGVLLLIALSRPGRRGRTALAVAVTGVLAATVVGHGVEAVRTPPPADEAHVADWLRNHAGPADGVVVGFGHPDIVLGSGLTSPYEHLWSLPVRVRDPHLGELQRVLAAPDAPRWMVVSGSGLGSWGLEATSAQQYLRDHYVEQVSYGDWHVWRRVGDPR